MSLLLLLRPHVLADGGPDPEPQPEQGQTPAGKKRHKRRYIVEIDGQEFEVSSVQEALELLDKASVLAERLAKQHSEQVVTKQLPKARRLGKVAQVQTRTVEITGSLPLYKELQAAKERIDRIYRDAAIAAELRLLMELDAERDEEEAILLSL